MRARLIWGHHPAWETSSPVRERSPLRTASHGGAVAVRVAAAAPSRGAKNRRAAPRTLGRDRPARRGASAGASPALSPAPRRRGRGSGLRGAGGERERGGARGGETRGGGGELAMAAARGRRGSRRGLPLWLAPRGGGRRGAAAGPAIPRRRCPGGCRGSGARRAAAAASSRGPARRGSGGGGGRCPASPASSSSWCPSAPWCWPRARWEPTWWVGDRPAAPRRYLPSRRGGARPAAAAGRGARSGGCAGTSGSFPGAGAARWAAPAPSLGGFDTSPVFQGLNDSAVRRGFPSAVPLACAVVTWAAGPPTPETPLPGCACGLARRCCWMPSWPVTRIKCQPFQFIPNKQQENLVGHLLHASCVC